MPAANSIIYNVTMTAANTEYSRALRDRIQKFSIQCRGNYDIKVAFVSGQSGTQYITVKAGSTYYEDMITPSSPTIYFQCATAAQVVEIITWS